MSFTYIECSNYKNCKIKYNYLKRQGSKHRRTEQGLPTYQNIPLQHLPNKFWSVFEESLLYVHQHHTFLFGIIIVMSSHTKCIKFRPRKHIHLSDRPEDFKYLCFDKINPKTPLILVFPSSCQNSTEPFKGGKQSGGCSENLPICSKTEDFYCITQSFADLEESALQNSFYQERQIDRVTQIEEHQLKSLHNL